MNHYGPLKVGTISAVYLNEGGQMAQILPHHMLSNLRSRLLKVCGCLGAVGGENPKHAGKEDL